MLRRRMLFALSCFVLLSAPVALADGPGFDTATVLEVHPLERRVAAETVTHQCASVTRNSRDLEGLYPGLAAAISGEAERHAGAACRPVRETVYRQEISGYRVRYRYGAGEYEQVMSYDPGATIRVRVQVRPGP